MLLQRLLLSVAEVLLLCHVLLLQDVRLVHEGLVHCLLVLKILEPIKREYYFVSTNQKRVLHYVNQSKERVTNLDSREGNGEK